MAKKDDSTKDQANPDMSLGMGFKEERQVPEKPKSKGGGVRLPMLLGIIGGILVVNIAAVLIFVRLFFPQLWNKGAENTDPNDKNKTEKLDDKSKKESSHGSEVSDAKSDYADWIDDKKYIQSVETKRIVTNPKGTSQFLAVNLGLIYIKLDEESKPEKKPAEGEAENAEKTGFTKELLKKVTSSINIKIGSLTVEELQQMKRDSLSKIFFKDLKPVLKQEHLYLKDVLLLEYIFQ